MNSSLFKGLGVLALLLALSLALPGCDPTPEMVDVEITSTEGGHVEEKVEGEWVKEDVEGVRSVGARTYIQLKAVADQFYEFAGWEVEGAKYGAEANLEKEEITVTDFEDGAEIKATFTDVREEYEVTFQEANDLEGVAIQVYADEDLEDPVGDEITTDADGEAVKDLLEGNYWFTASKENYEDYEGDFKVDGADLPVEFTMVEIIPEDYTVTFEEQNDLEDVSIQVFADSDLTEEVGAAIETDDEGKATKELEDGEYWFTAKLEGYQDYEGDFEVDGEPLTVPFTLEEIEKYEVTFTDPENGTLTAEVDDEEITSGDEVEEGKDVVFKATPDEGYRVKEWVVNDVVVDDKDSQTFTYEDLDQDIEVEVVLTEVVEKYEVTFADPDNGELTAQVNDDDIDSGDEVEEGRDVVFTVTPDEGYRVKEWKVNGDLVEDETDLTYTYENLDKDINVEVVLIEAYEVTFADPDNGELTALVDGNEISSGDIVESGKDVLFSASPDTGYEVEEWLVNDEVVEDETSLTFTYKDLDEDIDVAVKLVAKYEISFEIKDEEEEPVEGATIKLWEKEEDNDADSAMAIRIAENDNDYMEETTDDEGKAVFKVGVGEYEYEVTKEGFKKVEGTVEVEDDDVTVDVITLIQVFEVTFDQPDDGTLTAEVDDEDIDTGDLVEKGKDVEFTVVPDEGYRVKEWLVNEEVVDGETGLTYTHEDLDEDIVVAVVLEEEYKVTFIVEDEDEVAIEGAIVTLNDMGEETDTDGKAEFTVTAGEYDYTVNKEGYEEEEGTVDVDDDETVDVELKKLDKYTVTFADPAEGGELTATVDGEPITSGAEVYEGKDVVFTVDLDDGFEVVAWEVNDVTVPDETGTTYTHEDLEEEIVVEVVLEELDKHTVTFADPAEGGELTATVDGDPITSGAEVYEGKNIVFTVDLDEGFKVVAWEVNDVTVPDETGTTYTHEDLEEDIEVEVVLEEMEVSVDAKTKTVLDETKGEYLEFEAFINGEPLDLEDYSVEFFADEDVLARDEEPRTEAVDSNEDGLVHYYTPLGVETFEYWVEISYEGDLVGVSEPQEVQVLDPEGWAEVTDATLILDEDVDISVMVVDEEATLNPTQGTRHDEQPIKIPEKGYLPDWSHQVKDVESSDDTIVSTIAVKTLATPKNYVVLNAISPGTATITVTLLNDQTFDFDVDVKASPRKATTATAEDIAFSDVEGQAKVQINVLDQYDDPMKDEEIKLVDATDNFAFDPANPETDYQGNTESIVSKDNELTEGDYEISIENMDEEEIGTFNVIYSIADDEIVELELRIHPDSPAQDWVIDAYDPDKDEIKLYLVGLDEGGNVNAIATEDNNAFEIGGESYSYELSGDIDAVDDDGLKDNDIVYLLLKAVTEQTGTVTVDILDAEEDVQASATITIEYTVPEVTDLEVREPAKIELVPGGGSKEINEDRLDDLVKVECDVDYNLVDRTFDGNWLEFKVEAEDNTKLGYVRVRSSKTDVFTIEDNGNGIKLVTKDETTLESEAKLIFQLKDYGGTSEDIVATRELPVTFVPGALDTKKSSLELISDDPVAAGDQNVKLELKLRDKYENPIVGESKVEIKNGEWFDDPVIFDDEGNAKVTLSIHEADEYTDISVEVVYNGGSIEIGKFSVLIKPADLDPEKSTVSLVDEDPVAGTDFRIAVVAKDAFENRIPGFDKNDFAVSDDEADDIELVDFNLQEQAAGPRYMLFLKKETAEVVNISVTLDDVGIEQTVEVTVTPEEPKSIEIVNQPADTGAGEPIGSDDNGNPSVRVLDEFDNPVPDIEVEVGVVGEGFGEDKFAGGGEPVITDGEGIAIFDDLVLNDAGDYQLMFKVKGSDDPVIRVDSEEFTIYPAPADEDKSEVDPEEKDELNAGKDLKITFTFKDEFENPIKGDVELGGTLDDEGASVFFSLVEEDAGDIIAAEKGLEDLDEPKTDENGVIEVWLVATDIEQSGTVTAQVNGEGHKLMIEIIEVVPAELDEDESSVELISDDPVPAGADNIELKLTIKDEFGNPISGDDFQVRVFKAVNDVWLPATAIEFDEEGQATQKLDQETADDYEDIKVEIRERENGDWGEYIEIGTFDVIVVPVKVANAVVDFTLNDKNGKGRAVTWFNDVIEGNSGDWKIDTLIYSDEEIPAETEITVYYGEGTPGAIQQYHDPFELDEATSKIWLSELMDKAKGVENGHRTPLAGHSDKVTFIEIKVDVDLTTKITATVVTSKLGVEDNWEEGWYFELDKASAVIEFTE